MQEYDILRDGFRSLINVTFTMSVTYKRVTIKCFPLYKVAKAYDKLCCILEIIGGDGFGYSFLSRGGQKEEEESCSQTKGRNTK